MPSRSPTNDGLTAGSSVYIKQEASDAGDLNPPINFDTMSVTDLVYTLRDMIGGNITLCFATEREMFTTCCGEKFVTETADVEPGERIFTTYPDYPGGAPTSFNVHGREPSSRHTAQYNAAFYHADRTECREEAISRTSDLDDLHLVYCRRKPEFPVMGQSCDSCGGFDMSDGLRQTVQVEIKREGSISRHVFDAGHDCFRDWVKDITQTLSDTKSPADGTVTIEVKNMGMQFQMASDTSVNGVQEQMDLGRADSIQRLLDVTGTNRERRWL